QHDVDVVREQPRPSSRDVVTWLLLVEGDEVGDGIEPRPRELDDEVVLGREVVVERRLGEPEPVRDLPQRRRVVSLHREQLQRGVEDLLAGAHRRGHAGASLPYATFSSSRSASKRSAPATSVARVSPSMWDVSLTVV